MPPSPDNASPPPANRVELLPYGADALKFSLDSCPADQLADIEAHIASIKRKHAEAEAATQKKAATHPKPRSVIPTSVIPTPKAAASKVATPKVVAPKVAVSQLVSVSPASSVTGSPALAINVAPVGESPSHSPPPELVVEGSPSPSPIPRFKRRRGILSPPADVHMSSLPPPTPKGLFYSESEVTPSPEPAVPPPLPKRPKIPWSMELQDAASKAHKKLTLKIPPLSTPVSSSNPALVADPTLDPASVPKAKAARKLRAKVQNNEEFIRLCGIAAPAPVLSRAQHFFAVPSPEALGPLSSDSPPCASCLFQHQDCEKHWSQADELDRQKLAVDPPSPEEVSKILHLPACLTCTKKGIPHCSCSKPAPLAQYQAEALHTASISSYSSLHTRMRSLHVSWTQIQGQELLLQMAIISHHSQVSEFTADLIMAQRYHSNDPNYWVNSGLVVTKEDARKLFKAAHEVVEQPASGLDPTTTACRLYWAQGKFVCYCSAVHAEAPPFWAALPKPTTFMDCHQKAQSLMGLAVLPADAPDFVPSGQDLPPSMYQAPAKDQARAQRCWEWERRGPAAKAVASKPIPLPLVQSSVPRALAQPKASSSRVTLEESEEEEDLSS
ncbi:hypothetical protein P691DRAFT_767899 [Macrolepiota fuliginosa MF-IS2]|uniref:Uncharacterized protein n=1 Tax=Macrolepiota fuliginosa MF-IS2 TaxID=1400762 RepID=A0A9P5WYM2_9AGAR|nr:hypothetical protein P691DRAFT_767899 [Macrolepiota fuliginosa MF-IS2]